MGLERHWLPGHHGHHHHHDHQHAHDHNYDQNQLCRPYHQNHRHHFRACCRHNHQHSCGLHRPRIIRRSLQHWAPPTQSLLRLEFAHFRSQICPAALLHVGNKPRPRLPTCFRVFVARACFLLHSSERLSVMARAIRAPRAEWRAEGLKALSNYWWAYHVGICMRRLVGVACIHTCSICDGGKVAHHDMDTCAALGYLKSYFRILYWVNPFDNLGPNNMGCFPVLRCWWHQSES